MSHHKLQSPTAPLGFTTAGGIGKNAATHEAGSRIGMDGTGDWGRCQLGLATRPLRLYLEEESGQSKHKRQYVGRLFCNVSPSLRDTLKEYFNFEFRIFSGKPPSNSSLKPIP